MWTSLPHIFRNTLFDIKNLNFTMVRLIGLTCAEIWKYMFGNQHSYADHRKLDPNSATCFSLLGVGWLHKPLGAVATPGIDPTLSACLALSNVIGHNFFLHQIAQWCQFGRLCLQRVYKILCNLRKIHRWVCPVSYYKFNARVAVG